MLKLIILSLVFIFSFNSFCSIAKVVKVRGNVTALAPRDLKAHTVILGEKLIKDTSIVTGKGSIVVILFNDKSRTVVGPNSKIVVNKLKDSDIGIVGLLKGKLRASVVKNNKKDIKFIVKSKFASMGVRGTSFLATFNPKNNLSSLVTFTGSVAMTKNKKNKPIKNILNKLKSKKVIMVKKGRYLGISKGSKIKVDAVRIAPEQYARLKLNNSFGVDKNKIDNKKLKLEISKIKESYKKEPINKKSKIKEGGLVDIQTGLYIPPSSDSVYDKKTKMYKVSKTIGKFDDNGNYIAPKGLKLDAKDGFVSANNDSKSILKVKMLNNNIKRQISEIKRPVKVNLKDDLENIEDDVYDRYYE